MDWALVAGYDFFVSYYRGDASGYANGLVRALKNADFRCFLDKNDAAPGQPLTARLRWALRRSRVLLVVASPGITGSAWIPKEIEMFSQTKRDIIPINIEGGLQRAIAEDPRFGLLKEKDLIWIDEAAGVGPGDEPSAESIAGIARNFAHRRSNKFLRLFLGGIALIIFGFAVVAFYQRNVALEQRARATSTAVIADVDLAERYSSPTEPFNPHLLMHLARALRTDPAATLPQLRLASLLRDREWFIPELEPLSHDSRVISAQFSPDGRFVLTVAWSGTVTLWDSRNGRQVFPPIPHSSPVLAAGFSPDGSSFATVTATNELRVWSARTGASIRGPVALPGPVETEGVSLTLATRDFDQHIADEIGNSAGDPYPTGVVTFSPGSQRIFAAGHGTAGIIIDSTSGDTVGSPLEHAGRIAAAEFDRSGKRLATASEDNFVRVWDVDGIPTLLHKMQHHGQVLRLALNGDGSKVVSGSTDRTAKVWNVETGEMLLDLVGHDGWILDAKFSHSGKSIATASSDGTARLWNAQTGHMRGSTVRHGDLVTAVSISLDDRLLASASADRTIRVSRLRDGRSVTALSAHSGPVTDVEFAKQGNRLLSASVDRTARIWYLVSNRVSLPPLPNLDGMIVESTRGGGLNRLIVANPSSYPQLVDADTGKVIAKLPNTGEYLGGISASGHLVMTASSAKSLKFWDGFDGHLISELTYSGNLASAKLRRDGRFAVAAKGANDLTVLDVSDVASHGPRVVSVLQFGSAVRRAAFSADGRYLLVVCANDVTVFDGERAFRRLGHFAVTGQIVKEAISDDGRRLVVATRGGEVELFETRRGDSKRHTVRLGAELASLRFDASGAHLVATYGSEMTGNWRISIIDVTRTSVVGAPILFTFESADPRERTAIVDAIVDPKAMVVVTANRRNEVQLWHVISGKPLSDPVVQPRRVKRLAFSKKDRSVLVEYVDGSISSQGLLVDVSKAVPKWVPEFAESIAGRRFDETGAEVPASMEVWYFCQVDRVWEREGAENAYWNNIARRFCEPHESS